MSEQEQSSRKEPKNDKKVLLGNIAQTVNPLLRKLEQDQQSLVFMQ
jgi:hypothetical protein